MDEDVPFGHLQLGVLPMRVADADDFDAGGHLDEDNPENVLRGAKLKQDRARALCLFPTPEACVCQSLQNPGGP
jgi:hypothetical protein